MYFVVLMFFFFQAEDGIRDDLVTGVQTCALPISPEWRWGAASRAGFCAMRCESDSAGEQRGAPTPFRGGCPGGGESEQSSGWRANERMDGVPKRIEVGDFVPKEFQQAECDGKSKYPGMRNKPPPRR